MRPFPNLSTLINPATVAVVGASGREGSQGRRLLDNLLRHSALSGSVLPVNPAYERIGELPCWPSIADLPSGPIDVAIIIVNATRVLDVLRQCATRGIPFAIVLSSGFAETGPEGHRMEQDIAELCQATGLRVYGPNCPGLVNVRDRIGMCFSPAYKDDLNSGAIGLVTQGGGLGRNILQGLSHGEGVGLWFSPGNEADLQTADFIAFLARDPRTRVIAVLMEGIKEGARLACALALAREQGKRVVILKLGRSEAGMRAAQSHTASVAGSAAVNSAIFRQFGALEVSDLDELLAVSRLLSLPSPAPDTGICTLTFSGGTAAMAADIMGAAGLPQAVLQPQTTARLRELLPDFASVENPVDLTADVLRDPSVVRKCLDAVCADPGVGALLFPIPMDYGQTTGDMAHAIVEAAAATNKLVVPAWLSRRLGQGYTELETSGLLPFPSLTAAVAALSTVFPQRRTVASRAASATPEDGSRMLSEAQSKAILQAAGFPLPRRELARSADEAAGLAAAIGYPVVMKVVSAQILHKTEVGGVKLNIDSNDMAREAYDQILQAAQQHAPQAAVEGVLVERMLPAGRPEVLIGVHRDPTYGHVLTFGMGGVLVEVLRDVAHRLIPLAPEDAASIVREIKLSTILDGVRGQPRSDFPALRALILQVSDFVRARSDTLDELELNPVWVGAEGDGVVVLDALLGMRATKTCR